MKNIADKIDARGKVIEATSNDPWGPSKSTMSEIADLTYNITSMNEVMQMIWIRLNDSGKNWRHVHKALILLDYLVKHGNEKVAQQCKEYVEAIETLKYFQYYEDDKDLGCNVRVRAKELAGLLKDDERLKTERRRALREKTQVGVQFDPKIIEAYRALSRSNSFTEASTTRTSQTAPVLKSAQPSTATEEEAQFQLALAMSLKDAEMDEAEKMSDEYRLAIGISQSKEEYEKQVKAGHTQQEKKSYFDESMERDLALGISQSKVEYEKQVKAEHTQQEKKSYLNELMDLDLGQRTCALPEALIPPSAAPTPVLACPSGIPVPTSLLNQSVIPPGTHKPADALESFDSGQASMFAPEGNESVPIAGDLWNVGSNTSALESDILTLGNTSTSSADNLLSLSSNSLLPDGQQPSAPKSTVELFLGPNANLVNLDELVPRKPTNPFIMTDNALRDIQGNPFQPTNAPLSSSKPSINDLRNKQ